MPLTLSRAATIYSLNQLIDQEEEDLKGLGLKRIPSSALLNTPECPVRKVRSSVLPLYSFPAADGYKAKRIRSFGDLQTLAAGVPDIDDMYRHASSDDELMMAMENTSSDSGSSASAQVVPQRSVLDGLILAEWEDRAETGGIFRYDVTACPTRVMHGTYGFIAQLNEGRASKKRPTEFCIDQVAQPFDDSKFNFCKAMQREVLFQFQPSPGASPSFIPSAPVPESANLVFINVSPIEYGHVLLVPRALDNLNQLVSPSTMLLALQFAREANNPYFRVGYNSLGAYATVNHLHFQAYYLAAPMPLERAPTSPLTCIKSGGIHAASNPRTARGVTISQLSGYAVRGLVYEAGDSLEELATAVGAACEKLTEANIPHNLMIVDRGARVFLIPNAFAERKAKGEVPEDIMDSQVDPAVFEISGHIVLKRQKDYERADQEWAWRMLEYASFTEEKFADVVEMVVSSSISETSS